MKHTVILLTDMRGRSEGAQLIFLNKNQVSSGSDENNFSLISWSLFNMMEVNYNLKPSCALWGTGTGNGDLNLLL